jgi:ribosome maturation protein SDO1
MVTVDKAIIAKIEKDGKSFEILVDPELAYAIREGKQVSIANMLAVDDVFKDSKKGLPANRQDLENTFKTANIEEIAKIIVQHGEIQLTTEFRRKKLEEMKKRISDFISKNAIDPQTKRPHPQQRILNAMEQARVHIDVFKSDEEQIEAILESLRKIIPISFEKLKLEIRIPPQYSGRCFGIIKSFGTEPQYMKDGSLYALLQIPSGLKDEVFNKLNSITHGEAEIHEK